MLMVLIKAAISSHWLQPIGSRAGRETTALLKVSPLGEVLSVHVAKSSGDSRFDDSVLKAVWLSSPLPFPENPKYYDLIKQFQINFNPYE